MGALLVDSVCDTLQSLRRRAGNLCCPHDPARAPAAAGAQHQALPYDPCLPAGIRGAQDCCCGPAACRYLSRASLSSLEVMRSACRNQECAELLLVGQHEAL